MTIIAIMSVAALVFLLMGLSHGWTAAAFVSVLLGVYLSPFALSGAASSAHVGITDGSPRLYVYTVTSVVALFVCLGSPYVREVPKSVGLFVVFTLTFGVFVWEDNSAMRAGVIHFLIAALVWTISLVFGLSVKGRAPLMRLIATAVLFITAVEFVVAIAQSLALAVPLYGGGAFAGSILRVSGTLGHPGNLGKGLLLLLIVALPITKAKEPVLAKLGLASVFLILILMLMTFSRASIIGGLLTLVIWIMSDRVDRLRRKIGGLILVVVVSAPFLPTLVGRFLADPTGGQRPELTREALIQISRSPFAGTGPNNYVDVVGQFGWATEAGFPVHNVFLLLAAELGIVGAMLFLLPFASATIGTIVYAYRAAVVDKYARALLAATPGIVLTAYTGWGLLSQSILIMTVLVFGYTYGMSLAVREGSPQVLVTVAKAKNGRLAGV